MDSITLRICREAIEATIGRPDEIEGQETNYPCPFCIERKMARRSHLHVNYSKEVALCHLCGFRAGSLLFLVRTLCGEVPRSLARAHLGSDIITYVERLFSEPDVVEAKAKPVAKPKLPDGYVSLVGGRLPGDRVGRCALKYLRRRGINDRQIEDGGVGYGCSGLFRGYLIFPVYVGGRLLTYTSRRVTNVSGSKARHAFDAYSRMALFNYDAAMKAERVFIGEGPFDAWAMDGAVDKSDRGVGILGSVLHPEQAELLARLPAKELVLCLDADMRHKMSKTATALAKVASHKTVTYMLLDEGDPHDNRAKLASFYRRRKVAGWLSELDDILSA